MAKRRRLDAPTSPMEIALANTAPRAAPPPIAQVTGEASAVAAAEDALGLVEAARKEGRMVVELPLDKIARTHLTRDRISSSDEDMEALIRSIEAHGQRTPIEVVEIPTGYGLISGFRRLAALETLGRTTALALIRTPKDAGDAYLAMVEENEIRANLSYYERARIAAMSARAGAFETTEAALSALYGNVSRAKRSKIRSFVTLFEALDDALQFPETIPERLGLKIAGALKEGKEAVIKTALIPAAKTAEAEAARLAAILSPPAQAPTSQPEELAPGLTLEVTGQGKARRAVLGGAGLTDQMLDRLREALKP